MKKQFSLFFAMCLSIISIAQVNQLGINYQAQIRNSNGVLLPDSNVTIRFSLLPTQFAVTPTWKEEHAAITDSYGMIHVVIGKGTKLSGTVATFDLIDFSTGAYWIKTELGVGGTFFTLSSEPFQSVPYAKVAGNATPFPSGFIMPFAGDSTKVPNGWLLCDGREISRSQYSALYAVILDNWGRGNNSTTFNIPDLRGQFLRGVSYNSGSDPDSSSSVNNGIDGKRYAKYNGGNIGNKVGSYQKDTIVLHNHGIASRIGPFGTIDINFPNVGQGDSRYPGTVTNVPVQNTGGNETRPKNAYVNYLIKF